MEYSKIIAVRQEFSSETGIVPVGEDIGEKGNKIMMYNEIIPGKPVLNNKR